MRNKDKEGFPSKQYVKIQNRGSEKSDSCTNCFMWLKKEGNGPINTHTHRSGCSKILKFEFSSNRKKNIFCTSDLSQNRTQQLSKWYP